MAHDRPYTELMRSQHSIIPFLLRLTGFLTLICLLLIGVAAIVGNKIPATLVSISFSDIQKLYQQNVGLFLMDIRGALTAKVSKEHVTCCIKWSPDGTQIAFTGINRQVFIWNRIDLTTRQLKLHETASTVNGWSPDGQSILLTHYQSDVEYQELYRIELDGSNLKQLTYSSDAFGSIYFARWTWDGKFIVFGFATGNIVRVLEIYRTTPDGENLERLTPYRDYSYAPAISPDGEFIAFVSEQNNSTNLFIVDTDGSNEQQITFSHESKRQPVWSPDGTRILFQTYNNGAPILEVVNINGSERKRLVELSSPLGSISWSPDGTQILYEVENSAVIGTTLYIINADGSNRRLLIENRFALSLEAAWQPQP
jgi:TolB protein